jgi:RHS repeat-associated protein
VIQTYTSDEFGAPTQTQGTSAQPFQFTGQQRDATGLYDLRARMYDPIIGRFLQRDPLVGTPLSPLSLNRYGYALNNPLALVHPSGLSSNRVTGDGSAGSECFTQDSGASAGLLLSISCCNTPADARGYALVDRPSGPVLVPMAFFATTPGGGSGSGGGRWSPYFQVSVAGKDAFTKAGTASTDLLQTHPDIADVDAAFRETMNVNSKIPPPRGGEEGAMADLDLLYQLWG